MTEVVNFGCRINHYESETIKNITDNLNMTDVIIFNTCAVTKEAERQARQAIRKAKRNFPNKKIIVTGCAAQLNPQQFSSMAEVDRVIGNQEKLDSKFYLDTEEKIVVNDIMSVTETAPQFVQSFVDKSRAFLQIQNGCNHRCTFCIIPFARGNSRSVPLGGIAAMVRQVLENGHHEVVLTGVDISGYGADLPGKPTLAQTIKRLLSIVPELHRLRLSSIDVAEIDDELFDLLAYEPRLMPHAHLSLQSGDNMILKRMKRRHTREKVIEFCHDLRSRRKNVAFGADIIAGFPTETEEMFINSLNLVKEASIQYLHVFPYSERDGTPASKMPQIETHIRKERARKLIATGEIELQNFMKSQVGVKAQVVMEKHNIARTENFLTVKLDCSRELSGLHDVFIHDCINGQLFGKVIDNGR